MKPSGPQQYVSRRPKSGIATDRSRRVGRPRKPNQPGMGRVTATVAKSRGIRR
jgi:hypothetical protein